MDKQGLFRYDNYVVWLFEQNFHGVSVGGKTVKYINRYIYSSLYLPAAVTARKQLVGSLASAKPPFPVCYYLFNI